MRKPILNRTPGLPALSVPVALLVACLFGVAVMLPACSATEGAEQDFAQVLPDRVDYNFHVKPILSDRCYACHGPDENKLEAGLRLDLESGAKGRLESGGRAIVPGSARKSRIVERIFAADPGVVMPPPESNLHLSGYERALIRRWVEQGAEFKPHWSLIAPKRPEVPQDSNVSPIDAFVNQRLELEGLDPVVAADRERLIRRLSFDLTGLPPTLEQIDAFLADDDPGAYERVVDQMLASEAYGEHMAATWLDIARYADSHGYQDDGLRNMWPWRDWVIGAYNANMPYDEFITVQLAGDLLPNRTREQILATGFNRNHLQSQEGGIVPEEYRVDYVADRTNTVGRAFLGLTVECARCHDHKYDPISQREYFELFAFFNSVNEFGNIPYAGEASPTVILTSDEDERRLAQLASHIDSLSTLVEPMHSRFDAGFQAWRTGLGNGPLQVDLTSNRIGYFPLDGTPEREIINEASSDHDGYVWGDVDKELLVVEGRVGSALKLVGDPWIDMGKEFAWFERNEPFSVGLWLQIPDAGREGPLFNKAGGLFNGMRGYVAMLRKDGHLSASLNHVFPANSIEVVTDEPLPIGRWMHLTMTYDGSSRASGLRLYLDGRPLETVVAVDNLRMSTLYQVDPRTGMRSNWGDPGNLRIGWMEPNTVKLDSVEVDEFVVYDATLSELEVAVLATDGISSGESSGTGAVEIEGSAATSPTGDPDLDRQLREYYVTRHDPLFQKTFDELTGLRGEENEIMTRQPEVMVMEDLPEARPTFVLDRGAYDAPADRVEPGAPASLMDFGDDRPRDRRGLAAWLTDPGHPLTSRVAVNRLWQQFFGRGLVATPDDFGNQGARPSHPELLDWLAIEFIESGWDVKGLQKQIVMSDAYRRSSIVEPAARQRDPENVFMARGPSFRLTAEQIRDNVLAASGLLDRTIGGPPVKPYQPAGLWKELATRNATEYVQDSGSKLYRRALYTIWKRTTPPPSMVSFDAADRNVCTVKRQSTNTPLQALVLLNDPQYVESARVLAERVMKEVGDEDVVGDGARLTRMFRHLTGRVPRAYELETLGELLDEQQAAFAQYPKEASRMLAVGEWPVDTTLDPLELASYAVVSSTIMSFDETVYRR